MKKITALVLSLVLTLSLSALAASETAVGLPNPWVEYDSLEAAAESAGFELRIPYIPEELKITAIRLIVSPVGDFVSDNMVGELALRFNDGDFIHMVPYIKRGDNKNYDYTEKALGTRASHGCIRVQRKRTPKGTSMRWLWDTLRKKPHMGSVRVVIWEDVQGRQLPIPQPDLTLYYNANGGQNYHAAEVCFGVRDKYLPLKSFTYAELDTGDYARLTPCPYCFPPKRIAEIEEINAKYR